MPDSSAVALPTICVAGGGFMCAAGPRSTSGLPPARGTAPIPLLRTTAASIGASLSRAGARKQGGLKLGLAALPPKSAGVQISWERAALGKPFAVEDRDTQSIKATTRRRVAIKETKPDSSARPVSTYVTPGPVRPHGDEAHAAV